MTLWTHTSWLLLLVPLLLRVLPLPVDSGDRWRLKVDLPLVLLAAVASVVVKFLLISPLMMNHELFFVSDEPWVCATMHGTRTGSFDLVHRQPGAALFPALLSRWLGATDGLGWGALLSCGGLGALWFLAGRLLHGRTAGLLAVAWSCAMAPLVVMPRNITFYPEATFSMLFCLVCGLVALKRDDTWAIVLAGVGVGVALLADFVGLFFCVPTLAIGLIRVLRPPRKRWQVRLAALLLPVLISFGVGWVITPPNMAGLETQLRWYVEDLDGQIPRWATRLPDNTPPPEFEGDPGAVKHSPLQTWIGSRMPDLRANIKGSSTDYRWGRSNPLAIPLTVFRVFLYSQAKRNPNREFSYGEGTIDVERAKHVYPWLPVLLLSLVVFIWALRTRRWELAGIVLLLLPFASSLNYQLGTRVMHRFLFTPMSAWPLVMGVAWAWLAQRRRPPALSPAWLRLLAPVLVVCALSVLVAGALPSFLHPQAEWRESNNLGRSVWTFVGGREKFWKSANPPDWNAPEMRHLNFPVEEFKPCVDLFRDDVKRGNDPRGTLFQQWWRL